MTSRSVLRLTNMVNYDAELISLDKNACKEIKATILDDLRSGISAWGGESGRILRSRNSALY